jgi:hypothetical protein
MSEPAVESGSSVIRRALSARNRKANLATIARDLGVTAGALEASQVLRFTHEGHPV